jgi:hypothetical protein
MRWIVDLFSSWVVVLKKCCKDLLLGCLQNGEPVFLCHLFCVCVGPWRSVRRSGWVVHPFRSPCSKWSGWARWTRSRRRTRERAAKPSGRSERQEGRPCTRYRQRVTCGGVGVAVPRRAESARAPHATRRSCVLRLGRRWCVRTRCQSLSLSESRCWAGSSNRPGGDRALLLLPAWPRTELYPGRVTQMGCQNMGMGCPFDGSIKAD